MDCTPNLPRRSRCLYFAGLSFVLFFVLQTAYSSDSAAVIEESKPYHESQLSTRPFRHFAVGVTGGTQGAGVEVATTISRRTNLRVDGNFFNYSQTLSQDGVSYNANLRLRNYSATYDFFPWTGAFRLSAGFAAYNQFNVNAAATVPAGQTITLNDVDYYSSAADPLHGSATVAYPNKYAPLATFGWGNVIPRSGRRLAFPVEIGAAFAGTPAFNIAMAGSACATTDPATCQPVSTYSDFQTHLTAQRAKVNNDIAPFRVYPIVNMGFTYRFF
jgi:hypothetical protein